MQFFCPQCQTPMTTAGGISHVICPSCGLEINLELVDTNAGRPQMQLATDHTGTQIGPYQLHQCLGTGGMGSVYRATDTRDGSEVAIKVLYPQLAALPHVLARFHREAKALEKLQHHAIVRFIEAGSAEGQHYIAMCHVAGEDLGRLIARQAPDIPTALSLAQQVGEALAAAHARGVVHRDLKPANVMITPSGQVKVLDFGIAQFASQDHTLTHTDAVLGTFNFMSPEQRQGAKNVDHRCDLYALGAMLYLMLTGTLPIGVLEAPSRLNGAIGRQIERLILRLLQNDPAKRPQSATEVVNTLEAIRAAPNGRRPAVWATAAGLAVAVVAGAVYILGIQSNPVVARLDAPSKQHPSKTQSTPPTRSGAGEIPPATVENSQFGNSPEAQAAPDAQAVTDAGPDAAPAPAPNKTRQLRITKTVGKGTPALTKKAQLLETKRSKKRANKRRFKGRKRPRAPKGKLSPPSPPNQLSPVQGATLPTPTK